MKRIGVFCFLFFTGAYLFENIYLFNPLKSSLQEKNIPSSILTYGTLGKVLKKIGVVKATPKEDIFPDTYIAEQKTLLKILIDIDVNTELQVYWSSGEQKYSNERLAKTSVVVGRNEYVLALPSLEKIKRIRIDPSSESSNIRIERIALKQYEEKDVILSPSAGLDRVRAVNDIEELHLNSNGLAFKTINTDAQLELLVSDILGFDKIIEKKSFKKKRQKTPFFYTANPKGTSSFPSSAIIKKEYFKKKWPIVSVVVNDSDLYHPDTGIITNSTMRGRRWERPAYLSYFDERGQLSFATMAGIRIHGGKRLQLYNSFRFYFRKEYGVSCFDDFTPSIQFSSKTEPLKRLIVHHTAWPEGGWGFNNTFAYDIAKQIGCQVFDTKLTLLYVNGIKNPGIFFLVPQINKSLLNKHIGHKNFIFYKYKSGVTHDTLVINTKLFGLVKDRKKKLTAREVGQYVDLDNLAKHLFSFIFCGTTDYEQGVVVLDKSHPNNKFFWINWDMDQSFVDVSSQWHIDKKYIEFNSKKRPNWQQPGVGLVYKSDDYIFRDARTKIFNRLLREDDVYRSHVVSLYRDILNHKLTTDFFQERLSYYTEMLQNYGENDFAYINMLQDFVKKRPSFIFMEIKKILNTQPFFLLQIKDIKDIEYSIDEYEKNQEYQGYYFKGDIVNLKIINRKGFSHWIINGETVYKENLKFKINSRVNIKPIFYHD